MYVSGKKPHAQGSAPPQAAPVCSSAAGHGYPAVHIAQHGGFACPRVNGPGGQPSVFGPQHNGVVGGGSSFYRQGQTKAGQNGGLAARKLLGGLLPALLGLAAAATVIILRLLPIQYNWSLPRASTSLTDD